MLEFSFGGADGHPLLAFATVPIDRWDTSRETIVLLHAGGPDHRSLVPLGERLQRRWNIVLPDIRGYGRSVCVDPLAHTWAQYAADVVSLLDHLRLDRAFIVGVGIGTTITLRTAAAFPERVRAAVLISVEDIEDDTAKEREIVLIDAFRRCVLEKGLEAAWAPVLDHFPPIVNVMVRDAIPRSDRASIAAAAAIGNDRSFRSVAELGSIEVPMLIVPGIDSRHPLALARSIAAIMPNASLANSRMTIEMRTPEQFADGFAGEIAEFFENCGRRS